MTSTTDLKTRETRLRRMAARQDLTLVKSRRRDPLAQDFGTYALLDENSDGRHGLDLDGIEAALKDNELLDMAETATRETNLRRAAKRQGLTLEKSRTRDPCALAFGTYILVDDEDFVICGGPGGGFENGPLLDDIEDFLKRNAPVVRGRQRFGPPTPQQVRRIIEERLDGGRSRDNTAANCGVGNTVVERVVREERERRRAALDPEDH